MACLNPVNLAFMTVVMTVSNGRAVNIRFFETLIYTGCVPSSSVLVIGSSICRHSGMAEPVSLVDFGGISIMALGGGLVECRQVG